MFSMLYRKKDKTIVHMSNSSFFYLFLLALAVLASSCSEKVSFCGDKYEAAASDITCKQDGVLNLESISKFAKLKRLEITNFNGTIVGFHGLSKLENLEELLITGNTSSLTEISKIKSLESLYLTFSQIEDFAPLKDLSNLKELSLFPTDIQNLDQISYLTKLEKLHLRAPNLKNLDGAKKLVRLKWVMLGDAKEVSIEPLLYAKNLEVVLLPRNENLESISPLLHLKKLKEVDFHGTTVEEKELIALKEKFPNLKFWRSQ